MFGPLPDVLHGPAGGKVLTKRVKNWTFDSSLSLQGCMTVLIGTCLLTPVMTLMNLLMLLTPGCRIVRI